MQRSFLQPGIRSLGLALLMIAIPYLISCNTSTQAISNNITFHSKLSQYALFEGSMPDLVPAKGISLLQIGSQLFTDYAEKQRLIKIPDQKKATITGNGLPAFPDGTIIAKTFYYPKTEAGKRQIIETRLLVLSGGKWNAATYQWNADQTDADLLSDGAIISVSFEDRTGRYRKIAYQIPSQNDCSSCHRSGDKLVPLGPQARNLNIRLDIEGKSQSQLTYLMKHDVFTHSKTSAIASLPDYRDSSLVLADRARAYLEMNCAHCHKPAGMASSTSLNLEYTAPFEETGIGSNKENILLRMRVMGEYHMPKTGTTILDDDGVKLIGDYIKSLGSAQKH